MRKAKRLLPSRLSLSAPELHRLNTLGVLAGFTAGGDLHPALKTFSL